MFLAVVLTILGLGFLCWLLFSLAVYALPFFAAMTAGMWAYGTGAGVLGAFAVGLLAGVATLVLGQFLFGAVRSTIVRLALALAFAAPAAIAGYHAVLGLSAIGVQSEAWRQVFAVVGAAIVGFTAAARLTLFADTNTPYPPTRSDPDRASAPPIERWIDGQRIAPGSQPAPSAPTIAACSSSTRNGFRNTVVSDPATPSIAAVSE